MNKVVTSFLPHKHALQIQFTINLKLHAGLIVARLEILLGLWQTEVATDKQSIA